jgi:hypothetical protein
VVVVEVVKTTVDELPEKIAGAERKGGGEKRTTVTTNSHRPQNVMEFLPETGVVPYTTTALREIGS